MSSRLAPPEQPSHEPWPETLLRRIEDAGLNASAPTQQRWLDGWLVRTCPGKAKRARCINPVADGHLPLSERIALCEQAYHDASLPMIFRITPFCRPAGLDDTLHGLGLQRFDDTRVMLTTRLPQAQPEPGLTPEAVTSDQYAAAVGTLRGSPPEQQTAHAQRLRHSPVPYHGHVIREQGEIVACAQFAQEFDLVGLYDVHTASSHRGRGLARRLCTTLLAQAAARGARAAYLQVEHDNQPARAVYHRLGFQDAYAYHYRSREPGSA